jgi:hypothetical protein
MFEPKSCRLNAESNRSDEQDESQREDLIDLGRRDVRGRMQDQKKSEK